MSHHQESQRSRKKNKERPPLVGGLFEKRKSADERSEEMVTTGSGQGLLFCSVFVVCAIDFARVNGSLRKYARSLRSLSSSALRCARVPYLRCMRTRSTIMASPKRAYTERIIFMENLRECGGSVRKKNFCVNKGFLAIGGLFIKRCRGHRDMVTSLQ
jgi:hypothetical protein